MFAGVLDGVFSEGISRRWPVWNTHAATTILNIQEKLVQTNFQAVFWHHSSSPTPSVRTHQSCVGAAMIVDLLVVIHPNLCRPHAVCQRLAPGVRGPFRKHMTHVGARVDFQAAPALPNLRYFNHNSLTKVIQSANTKQSYKKKAYKKKQQLCF